jgi:hypothetical protein
MFFAYMVSYIAAPCELLIVTAESLWRVTGESLPSRCRVAADLLPSLYGEKLADARGCIHPITDTLTRFSFLMTLDNSHS